jgi:hypothetical protein
MRRCEMVLDQRRSANMMPCTRTPNNSVFNQIDYRRLKDVAVPTTDCCSNRTANRMQMYFLLTSFTYGNCQHETGWTKIRFPERAGKFLCLLESPNLSRRSNTRLLTNKAAGREADGLILSSADDKNAQILYSTATLSRRGASAKAA